MQTCYRKLANTELIIIELAECPVKDALFKHDKLVRVFADSGEVITWKHDIVDAVYPDGSKRRWHIRKSKVEMIKEVLSQTGMFIQFLSDGSVFLSSPEWHYYWGPPKKQVPVVGRYEVLEWDEEAGEYYPILPNICAYCCNDIELDECICYW